MIRSFIILSYAQSRAVTCWDDPLLPDSQHQGLRVCLVRSICNLLRCLRDCEFSGTANRLISKDLTEVGLRLQASERLTLRRYRLYYREFFRNVGDFTNTEVPVVNPWNRHDDSPEQY